MYKLICSIKTYKKKRVLYESKMSLELVVNRKKLTLATSQGIVTIVFIVLYNQAKRHMALVFCRSIANTILAPLRFVTKLKSLSS
ncbi:hypothetical protein BD408DRAFT_242412 [Parasitella parasitica]|nr:hypothetical protein BD408DRAFT_242412 [Parasitella parasitica]